MRDPAARAPSDAEHDVRRGASTPNLGSADQAVVAIVTLVLITVLNIYGVKLVAIVNNTGVIFEILGMVVFAIILAIAHNDQGFGVIVNSDKTGNIFEFPAPFTLSFFLVAMFMSLYVIYGFDTASTLAEETRNPRQEAPKAVLGSVAGAFVIGAIFLWGVLVAVPNMADAVAGFFGPADDHRFGPVDTLTVIYLLVVSAAIFVCCMSILTSTIRLAFGMARDDQLPFSKRMAKVNPRLHTPVATCVIIGALSAIPFIQFSGPTVIAVGATASIYLSYLLGNLAVMRARTQRLAEEQGAVLAREVGQARQRRRHRVGTRDVAQLPHAGVGEQRRSIRTPPVRTTCGSSRTPRRSRPTGTSRETSSSTSRSTS